jgi:hypothetical protein
MGTRRAIKSTERKTLQRRTRQPERKRTIARRPVVATHQPTLSLDDEDLAAVSPDGKSPLFRDDPVVDRRIIEGMLNDRGSLMTDMAKIGYSQSQVMRRAAELGLSEALIRQVRGVAADLAGERPGRRGAPPTLGARGCLSCDRVFLSTGPGNRLCMRCRGGDAGLAQL